MQRARAVIGGNAVDLEYTVSVMCDANDQYNTVGNMLEIMQKDDRESFGALRWFIIRTANEAAVCDGRSDYYTEDEISEHIRPVDFIALRNSAMEAIAIGYGREIKEKGQRDRDLGLEELQKKTGKRARGRKSFTKR